MNIKITALCALLIIGLSLIAARTRNVQSGLKEISTAQEYEKIRSSMRRPTIFVFNSATCEACKMMTKGLEVCAKKYSQADFYVISDLKCDAFKGLPQKLKIKGYPTTLFCKPRAEPNVERGSIDADELDEIVHKFVHGKPRPIAAKPAAPPVPAKPAAPSVAQKE